MGRFTFGFPTQWNSDRNEMTAEAWVFPTVLSDDNHKIALARGYSMDPLESAWLMDVRGALDTPRFLSNHLDIGNRVLDAPSGVPLNQWTHLAISFDGTTKRLFVNGVEVASQSGLSALVYDPASVPVTIGCGWQRNAPIYKVHRPRGRSEPLPACLVSGRDIRPLRCWVRWQERYRTLYQFVI